MFFQQRTERVPIVPRAQGEKNFVGAAEIRTSILNGAAEVDKCFSLRFQNCSNPAIQRQSAEIETPGDSRVSLKLRSSGLAKTERIAGIRQADRADRHPPSR